ncbi:MAG: hypothetical protein M3394_03240 [Actinomycetota bacterium]|nr:hypothetical protein [Actinomycetota bacterium]
MKKKRWWLRVATCAGLVAPLLALSSEAPATICRPGTGSLVPQTSGYVDVRNGGTLYACISAGANDPAVRLFLTPSQTTTTADEYGLTMKVKGGACVEVTWFDNGCVQDPTFTLFQGRYVDASLAPTASVGSTTTLGPCVTEWTSYQGFLDDFGIGAGMVCVYAGSNASATRRADKQHFVDVVPGVCVSYDRPSYWFVCYSVFFQTTVDGRSTVPVVRETVAVCERGYYYYPECIVRLDQRVP